LGRLAACFMESMASVDIPAYGYGIRYQHGLFKQKIKDGQQIELPEDWLAHGNPWEFERQEAAYEIGFGGTIETVEKDDNSLKHTWIPSETVEAIAFDTPIAGWRGRRVNTLRLWGARHWIRSGSMPSIAAITWARSPNRRGRKRSRKCSIPR